MLHAYISLNAQITSTLADIPTPNAQDLGKYGFTPMNYYTGRANVSIPIYHTEQKGVPLTISLNYDTGGLLMNTLPGWTGHGWTLNAGGCITRVINHFADEFALENPEEFQTNYVSYFNSPSKLSELVDSRNYDDIPKYANGIMIDKDTLYDLSPDIFYFNFMGKTGCFFLDANGKWRVQSDENIKVVFDIHDPNNYKYPFINRFPNDNGKIRYMPKTIKGFTLIDENGIKYYFGCDDKSYGNAIEYSIDFFCMSDKNRECPWIANSWYLTQIKDRFGNDLYNFYYDRGKFILQIEDISECIHAYSNYSSHDNSEPSVFDEINLCTDGAPNIPYHIVLNSPVYLSQIKTLDIDLIDFFRDDASMSIKATEFYPSFNRSLSGNGDFYYRLTQKVQTETETLPFYYLQAYSKDITQYLADSVQKIRQRNENSYNIIPDWNLLSTIEFNPLNYIQIWHAGNIQKVYFKYEKEPRLHLRELDMTYEDNMNDDVLDCKYIMGYNNYQFIPKDYLTRYVDYCGYYNGDANNSLPNSEKSRYGMLNKLTYPTGGYTKFEYELNDYSIYQTPNRREVRNTTLHDHNAINNSAGGLRIKKLTDYDSNDIKLDTRNFEYLIPNSNISSGQCCAEPNNNSRFIFKYQTNKSTGKADYIAYIDINKKTSVIPLYSSFSPNVGYSYVSEQYEDNSKNVYQYTNLSDFQDLQPIYSYNVSDTCFTPYQRYTERGYMRGKMISETNYNSNGVKERCLSYQYRSDFQDYDYSVLATNATYYSNSGVSATFTFKVGNVYHLLYPKFDIARKKDVTYIGNDSVVTCTDYHNIDYKIGSDSAIIRKCLSEIVHRKDQTLEKVYTYPINNTIFANSYFLPVVSTVQKFNDVIVQKKETDYGLQNNHIQPVSEKVYIGTNANASIGLLYDTYDINGFLTQYTELGKASTYLSWNELGKLASSTILSHQFLYDYENGMLKNSTRPNGLSFQYEYDGFGRLSSIKRDSNILQKFYYNYKNR